MLQVNETELREMFLAMGFKSAKTWKKAKFEAQIEELPDLDFNPDDLKDDNPEERKLLKKLLAAKEKGTTIAVVADGTEATPAEDKPAKKKPAKEEDEVVPVKKPKEKKAAPAPKEKKERAPAKGVRETRTRPYLCGVIIRKHCGDLTREAMLGEGVTEKMVAELNKAYGKENDAESWFALRNAWHAVRGAVLGSEEDLKKPKG